ncbi:MAG: primosomal protein N' [Coriobacteriales bacterium]|jgi:primosomal protein N' (replication factor Y)|nr:primosomal protein N' [Coriobacteriales bacterium]
MLNNQAISEQTDVSNTAQQANQTEPFEQIAMPDKIPGGAGSRTPVKTKRAQGELNADDGCSSISLAEVGGCPASNPPLYAQVALDIPTRALDRSYDYRVPAALVTQAQVGCSVLVDFAGRPALGYLVGLGPCPTTKLDPTRIKELQGVLSTPFFDAASVELAHWIAAEYLAPLSDCLRLFTPPGARPTVRKDASGTWQLYHPQAGPVDVRWVCLTDFGRDYMPPKSAHKQRAIIEALRFGEMRVLDLAIEVSTPAAALRALEKRGVVKLENRRRIRGNSRLNGQSQDIVKLTAGQRDALDVISRALDKAATPPGSLPGTPSGSPIMSSDGVIDSGKTDPSVNSPNSVTGSDKTDPSVILLDGVTGSGKTEVYLQAIRQVLEAGGSACVLVPEISLTPQTTVRFRSRFGEQVAVLHSRLSVGERFDQWDTLRSGSARVVVGARSALFAPLSKLRLIVIDEEHESTYKQGSSPRYASRDVAIKRAQLTGAVVVLGSATPSMESLADVGALDEYADVSTNTVDTTPTTPTTRQTSQSQSTGQFILSDQTAQTTGRVILPERVSGRPLPQVEVVNLSAEFRAGNKSMYSVKLQRALQETIERAEKAVLLLNRRGFASVLLCRDCGFVPTCANCETSMTFHQHPPHLLCHYCDTRLPSPPVCPECGSPYLRQLGPGTQFAVEQLAGILPTNTPIIRMDADTTKHKDGHTQRLEEFMAASSGILLGTQMIAKGLDFAEVTLVGVLIADTALKFPDFRAAERTYQLLEQVAGRAGRAEKDGRVIVQTYWPEHVAIRAAAAHDRSLLLESECQIRSSLGYPPFGRLANILVWGEDRDAVIAHSHTLAECLKPALSQSWQLLGPSPCVMAKRKGQHRWHLLIKAPVQAHLAAVLAPALRQIKTVKGVHTAVDIDPQDLM